ncbi:hypothetical protein MORTIMER_90 [Erwinia phage vB_EamM_Mortimer]|uniref:Uncharacterized protein n=1 Tax=Erwinia phage vB_EamM_Mortimer TaxID=2060129 RepID=A0A2H5BKI4_9CAUD|nr:hypothetical protein MORTIMER_90 [Erwinia phage vB_EamM_Mortimer]
MRTFPLNLPKGSLSTSNRCHEVCLMKNDLSSFMKNTICTLTVVQQRIGGSFCAFLSAEHHAEAMADDAGGKHGNHDNLENGLFSTDWFPVGFGETPREAVTDLEERVINFTNISGDPKGWVYNHLFNMLVCRVYRETGTGHYTLQPALFPEVIPDWLKHFDKLDEDLVDDFIKRIPISQDDGWTPL